MTNLYFVDKLKIKSTKCPSFNLIQFKKSNNFFLIFSLNIELKSSNKQNSNDKKNYDFQSKQLL